MSRCECCQEESVLLVPVMNYDATSPYEHDLVCPTCADFIASVHPALYHMQVFTLRQKKLTSASFGAVFSFDVEFLHSDDGFDGRELSSAGVMEVVA